MKEHLSIDTRISIGCSDTENGCINTGILRNGDSKDITIKDRRVIIHILQGDGDIGICPSWWTGTIYSFYFQDVYIWWNIKVISSRISVDITCNFVYVKEIGIFTWDKAVHNISKHAFIHVGSLNLYHKSAIRGILWNGSRVFLLQEHRSIIVNVRHTHSHHCSITK